MHPDTGADSNNQTGGKTMKHAITLALLLAACTPYTPDYETRPAQKSLAYYMSQSVEALWGNEEREGRR